LLPAIFLHFCLLSACSVSEDSLRNGLSPNSPSILFPSSRRRNALFMSPFLWPFCRRHRLRIIIPLFSQFFRALSSPFVFFRDLPLPIVPFVLLFPHPSRIPFSLSFLFFSISLQPHYRVSSPSLTTFVTEISILRSSDVGPSLSSAPLSVRAHSLHILRLFRSTPVLAEVFPPLW